MDLNSLNWQYVGITVNGEEVGGAYFLMLPRPGEQMTCYFNGNEYQGKVEKVDWVVSDDNPNIDVTVHLRGCKKL